MGGQEQRESVIGAGDVDNGVGLCGWLLTMISWGLVLVTLPFSLCVCFKVSLQTDSSADHFTSEHQAKRLYSQAEQQPQQGKV